jgi:hypothetical protein
MAVSAHFGNSPQMRHVGHDSPSEENHSGCVLANLLSQSLAVYVELEKAHWHLRLNKAGHAVNFQSEGGPTEIAREVCTISLRLIASYLVYNASLIPTSVLNVPHCVPWSRRRLPRTANLRATGNMTPGWTLRLLCPRGQVIHESHEEMQPHVAGALSSSNWTERERFARPEYQVETENSSPNGTSFRFP